jgi:transporter family protein
MSSWVIYAILSAIFAALVAIFGKIGVSGIDTTFATTVRAIIMSIFLVLVSLLLGKFKFAATLKSKAFYFIILSGIAGALSWLFYFVALKSATNTQVPAVAALDRLSVVFVWIFAILFLGDKLTLKSAFGAILITIGAILMALK